jgi:hypothetical protein
MIRTLTRTLIAGTAITGALTFGAAGLAGATTPTSSSSPTSSATSPATLATRCAKAEARVPKINAREAKAAAWVTKAEAREVKAKAGGHTKIATRIENRITRVQKLEARGTTLLARIAAKCGAATGTPAG